MAPEVSSSNPLAPLVPPVTLGEELAKDAWVHIGGLVAIAFGAFDHFYLGPRGFGDTTDLLLIVGGLAAQGVKIVNGSANAAAAAAAGAIGNIAATVAAQQALAAATAAATLTTQARAASVAVTETAGHAAAALAASPQVFPPAPPAPPFTPGGPTQ